MFPGSFNVHQGDPGSTLGKTIFQVYTKDVKTNLVVNKLPVPEPVRTAKTRFGQGGHTEACGPRLAAGGGPMNSVLVEFKDFVAVVEAPQNEARSLAVIDEVHKLVPGQDDSLRGQYESPHDVCRWSPHLFLAGHHGRHPRVEQRLLRWNLVQSVPEDVGP